MLLINLDLTPICIMLLMSIFPRINQSTYSFSTEWTNDMNTHSLLVCFVGFIHQLGAD